MDNNTVTVDKSYYISTSWDYSDGTATYHLPNLGRDINVPIIGSGYRISFVEPCLMYDWQCSSTKGSIYPYYNRIMNHSNVKVGFSCYQWSSENKGAFVAMPNLLEKQTESFSSRKFWAKEIVVGNMKA